MTLMAGSQLGPYEIVSQLGSGGMGVVYRAHDPRLDRSVAIKLLPPDLTRDETAKQRFLQEAKAASALDHPNICTIYEINETEDGQLYLVMAHYEGETLKERISRGPLDLNDAIDIATQVGEGLAEAHKAGIVHRDIKPANLLVTKTGVVKILDFGLAKLAGSEGVTQTGTTVGTVAYMSPEQAKGQEVDQRTDIWSLGVVLYEMLAGAPPFQGENLLSLADAIRGSEPQPLTGSSAAAQPAVGKALGKDKAQRYQAVSAFLHDLRTGSKPTAVVVATQESNVPSIAVLPFDDMSPGKDQDYFCEGMAEEIINALTRLSGLHVASRTSTFLAKANKFDIARIGSSLNVKTVLEGSVRKAGNRLRVTAQLINVTDGYHIWSERYDRDLEDVFAVQDEITRAVVEQLKVQLLSAQDTVLVTSPSDNLDAYEAYVMGRHYRYSHYNLQKALEYFEQAVQLDPSYAAAHAGIADTAATMGVLGLLSTQAAVAAAKPAATQALSLDEGSSEVHDAVARVRFYFDRDWDSAEHAFQRALELNPRNAEARCGYAFYLASLARPEEAVDQVRQAEILDPLSPYPPSIGTFTYIAAERYDDAIAAGRHALDLGPNPLAYWYLSMAYTETGRPDDALALLNAVPHHISELPFHSVVVGYALAATGAAGEVERILTRLKEKRRTGHFPSSVIGGLLSAVGEVDQAIEWCTRGLEEKDTNFVSLQLPAFYRNVHSDPRFQALLKKMNFPAQR